MRQPTDMGAIYEGRELVGTVGSHASTFMAVSSIAVEIVQHGAEPPLSTETRSALFSIVHNALANALRHTDATRVVIELDLGAMTCRSPYLTTMPDCQRIIGEGGHGFAGMRVAAERLDGRLIVECWWRRWRDGGALRRAIQRKREGASS